MLGEKVVTKKHKNIIIADIYRLFENVTTSFLVFPSLFHSLDYIYAGEPPWSTLSLIYSAQYLLF